MSHSLTITMTLKADRFDATEAGVAYDVIMTACTALYISCRRNKEAIDGSG